MVNTGDVIFQLFTLVLVFGILSLIIILLRSRKTTKKRIDRLEKEVMELKSETKR
ncbi:hypothetical protein ACTSEZ_01675 [Metabacillus sp. JX24]|uniref:hypothetical protein n=1 Tax=Metabacillus sp. JX24 TaxID=3240759 RepID=UPI00350FE1B4